MNTRVDCRGLQWHGIRLIWLRKGPKTGPTTGRSCHLEKLLASSSAGHRRLTACEQLLKMTMLSNAQQGAAVSTMR